MSEPVKRYEILGIAPLKGNEALSDGTVVVLAADYERLERKYNEMADQQSADTQRFIDCTNKVKALVPEATSLENGLERLDREVAHQAEQHRLAVLNWEMQRDELEREHAALLAQYYELLYAVSNKHPNETRHQTALRYIQERERHTDGPAQSSLLAGREKV